MRTPKFSTIHKIISNNNWTKIRSCEPNFMQVHVPNFGGYQGRRTGVGVTTVSNLSSPLRRGGSFEDRTHEISGI